MMFHPRDKTMVVRGGLACVDAVFKFYGKAAHAASAPQNGISALDAVIHTFNGINALRQMFTDDMRARHHFRWRQRDQYCSGLCGGEVPDAGQYGQRAEHC